MLARMVVCTVGLIIVVPWSAEAALIAHNGTVTSTPPGSGEVPVYLDGSTLPGLVMYGAVDSHFVVWQYDAGTAQTVSALFHNSTLQSWQAFVVQLMGADFFETDDSPVSVPAVNPVVEGGTPGDNLIHAGTTGSVTFAGSEITRTDESAGLLILFGDPVDPGESFVIVFSAHDVGEPGLPDAAPDIFVAVSTPVVPEPAMLTLLALGALAMIRRRR